MKIRWHLDRKQTLLLAAVSVALFALLILFMLGTVLIALGLSVIIAYMLLTPVRLIERAMPWREARPVLSRNLSIAIVFVLSIAIVAGALFVIVPSAVEESNEFADEVPTLIESVRKTVEGWIDRYTEEIPVATRDRIERTLEDASGVVGDVAWSFASSTFSTLSSSFALIISLVVAPVLVYGLLKDSIRIRASLYAPFPPNLQPYLKHLLDIAEKTLGGFIRGQLILAIIVGSVVTVGLQIMGVPFAFVLGIVAGLMNLVPMIGPLIGGLFGVLVTLAVAPEKVLWVIPFYLAVQLVENTLLSGRIQGNALKLHPVWLTVIVVVAGKYFGIWGIIIGPPVVAMVRDMAVWLSEEWNKPEEEGEAEESEGEAEEAESVAEEAEREAEEPG